MNFPPLLPVAEIQERLQSIFPDGTQYRSDCINLIAARTIFVMQYLGAVEGADVWLRPDQVTRMTGAQAAKGSDGDRTAWRALSMASGKGDVPVAGTQATRANLFATTPCAWG